MYVLIALLIGFVFGVYFTRKLNLNSIKYYFMCDGRTMRASADFARVILNGTYVQKFHVESLNSKNKGDIK
jgi:hypothetical protein